MCLFQVIKIEWVNKEMREISFTFLWNKFKCKYLMWLLPDFYARDIYEPVLGDCLLKFKVFIRHI
jgi:hypothetical protein